MNHAIVGIEDLLRGIGFLRHPETPLSKFPEVRAGEKPFWYKWRSEQGILDAWFDIVTLKHGDELDGLTIHQYPLSILLEPINLEYTLPSASGRKAIDILIETYLIPNCRSVSTPWYSVVKE